MKKLILAVFAISVFTSVGFSAAPRDLSDRSTDLKTSAGAKIATNCINGAAFHAVRELMATEYINGQQIAANANAVTRTFLAHSVIPDVSTVKNVEVYHVIVHSRVLDQKTGTSQVDGSEIYTVEMIDKGGALCPLSKIEVTKI